MIYALLAAIESAEDRDIMTEFFEQYHLLMYDEARKLLSNTQDIEDIVYEALVKIIERMSVFRGLVPAQRIKYALTAVRNLCCSFLKRSNIIAFISLEEFDFGVFEDLDSPTEETVEKKLFCQYVRQVWRELKLEDRMLLEQKYILKWRDDELAESLGIKPQSVRMRLSRTKDKIMKELKKRGIIAQDLW